MSSEEAKAINERLDRLERLALLSSKVVLNLDEACLVTSLSKGHIYRLTSEKQIPHYKKNQKLYFKKSELEDWLLETKVFSESEIKSKATTYTAIKKH